MHARMQYVQICLAESSTLYDHETIDDLNVHNMYAMYTYL